MREIHRDGPDIKKALFSFIVNAVKKRFRLLINLGLDPKDTEAPQTIIIGHGLDNVCAIAEYIDIGTHQGAVEPRDAKLN